MLALAGALTPLAGVLVALGEPAEAPLARFTTLTADKVGSLAPAEAAEQGVALVHAVLQAFRGKGAVTQVAKRVGNAALGIKRALATDAARRERIALREATRQPPARPGKKKDAARLAA
jgi:hypothetical protein